MNVGNEAQLWELGVLMNLIVVAFNGNAVLLDERRQLRTCLPCHIEIQLCVSVAFATCF